MTGNSKAKSLGENSKPKSKFLKLLKHDFLASARLISLFYIIEAVLMVLYKLGHYLGTHTENPGAIVSKLIGFAPWAIVLAFVTAFALIILTMFFIIFDFFKSLYSPQGYLSFTLPVSSEELLLSKTLVYGAWMGVSFLDFYFVTEQLAAFLSMFAEQQLGEDGVAMGEMLLTQVFNFPSISQIIASAVFMMLNVFSLMYLFVASAYFTITVSHMRWFQKLSVLWSILLFFPVFLFLFWLACKPADYFHMIVQFKDSGELGFGIVKAGEAIYERGYDISRMIMCLAECVGLFFATSFIMHKKVNIK